MRRRPFPPLDAGEGPPGPHHGNNNNLKLCCTYTIRMATGAGAAPNGPVGITLRRVDSFTVSELDDIRAVTSGYIDTGRPISRRSRAGCPRLACGTTGPTAGPETGVASRSGRKPPRPTAAPPDAAALSGPDVRFFDQVNPGHRRGGRLIGPAASPAANLTGASARMLRF